MDAEYSVHQSDLDRLREEAKSIGQRAATAAEFHFAAETPWHRLYNWLGGAAAALAAVGGAIGLASPASGLLVGMISIVVAGVSSVTTFLNPKQKGNEHHRAAKSYEALYTDAGLFLRIESKDPKARLPQLAQRVKSLTARFNELRASSPPISGRAYEVARKVVADGWGEVVRDARDPPEERGNASRNSGIPSEYQS